MKITYNITPTTSTIENIEYTKEQLESISFCQNDVDLQHLVITMISEHIKLLTNHLTHNEVNIHD